MLTVIAALVCGLLPGFAWLIFYLGEDDHAEPKRLIIFTFIVGIAFGFFTVAIEELFNNAVAGIGIQEFSLISLVGLALIEEFMKFAAAHFAVSKSPEFHAPIDAMIYMIIAALGFATLENIGAIANLSPHTVFLPGFLETAALRFVGATLLHTLSSGIVGFYWALGIKRKKVVRYLATGFTIATLLHACFNSLILYYGNSMYTLVFLVIVGFFVLNDFEKVKEPQFA